MHRRPLLPAALLSAGFAGALAPTPTAQSIALVADLEPGIGGSTPTGYHDWITHIFFAARTAAAGTELFATDGTPAGTYLVKDIDRGSASSDPRDLFQVGVGRALFTASTRLFGRELWVTNGTDAGTTQLVDLLPGRAGSNPSGFIWSRAAGGVVFAADDALSGREPWVTDGTAAGTRVLTDINTGPNGSYPTGFVARPDGTLFFAATDDLFGTELWTFDGRAALRVKDINPGSVSSDPVRLTALGDRVLFFAGSPGFGVEPWASDGTEGGTAMLADIYPGFGSSFVPLYTEHAVFEGRLYFPARSSTEGVELWSSDGTPAGTSLVADIHPGSGSSNPQWLTVTNRFLYFTAIDPAIGEELFVISRSGGQPVAIDVEPGPDGSAPHNLFADGDDVLFAATRSTTGPAPALWLCDFGTRVTIVSPDPHTPASFVSTMRGIMFTATSTQHGQEAWLLQSRNASWFPYDNPCGPLEALLLSDPPRIGWPLIISTTGPVDAAAGTGMLSLRPTHRIQASGCQAEISPEASLFLNLRLDRITGKWSTSVDVPNSPDLYGLGAAAKFLFLDRSGRLSVSRGVTYVFGD